ncbi:MAG: response regulator [Symploca sp. SIO2E9]|nr:response regulator [Symploca sp. SIO2E9]
MSCNLYWLDQIQSSERLLVGNRAFHLSKLRQLGYPVITGFVVPASAFWKFLELLGESQPSLADLADSDLHLDVDNPRQLQLVAQQIRQQITTAPLPPSWELLLTRAAQAQPAPAMVLYPSLSLRSPVERIGDYNFEAPASIFDQINNPYCLPPGIWESHICLNQPEALILSLKRVWAQMFRARSLFYWQRAGIKLQQLSLAVLIQPLWNACTSGSMLADATEWNIQATWGLETALCKGEVLPDTYHLEAQTGTLLASQLGNKTRAYRLNQESLTPKQNCLQAYLLSEEQQQQYALEEKYLQQLIALSHRLRAEFNQTFSLEWTICQTPEHSEPRLYITQFSPQTRIVSYESWRSHSILTPDITPQLVRGLAAAAGRVSAPAQVIIDKDENLAEMIQGKILVAKSVAPDWLPWLKQAAGIVTEEGTMTSHAAIIARELGLPAVVSAAGITQLIKTGEHLLLDGDQGEIYRLGSGERGKEGEGERGRGGEYLLSNSGIQQQPPSSNHQSNHRSNGQRLNFQQPQPGRAMLGKHMANTKRNLPSNYSNLNQFPIATQLLVNLSQPDSLEKIVGLPVDGIGLLRSELMMLSALENLHPSEWLRQGRQDELVERLTELIVKFAAALAPRPVLYRSWDWRSHEFQSLIGDPLASETEVNPIVGLRGTRRYLIDPSCFDVELAALRQVYSYGYTNIQLMLPFVRTVEEFNFCRRRAEQAGLTDNPHFQIWIMAEVPSVLLLLPDYVKAGVQGISIGSNDLTQLLLAVDRDQGQFSEVLDGRHPAVKRAIKQLIYMSKEDGIPCSICGQAPAQYPELIDSLVQWGITSISVDLNALESTYIAIARAEQRLLLESLRSNKFGEE